MENKDKLKEIDIKIVCVIILMIQFEDVDICFSDTFLDNK